MALFAHICKHFSSINGTTFIATIEVLSRKNGKPQFLVYGAFCSLPPLFETDEVSEADTFIFTECADMRNADVVFNQYYRGFISRFSTAPHGFQRFVERWKKQRELEIEMIFDYFPRWISEGKKAGRRRVAKKPKYVSMVFGEPKTILALRQRELSHAQNKLNHPMDLLTEDEIEEARVNIDTLKQGVAIARQEVFACMRNQQR